VSWRRQHPTAMPRSGVSPSLDPCLGRFGGPRSLGGGNTIRKHKTCLGLRILGMLSSHVTQCYPVLLKSRNSASPTCGSRPARQAGRQSPSGHQKRTAAAAQRSLGTSTRLSDISRAFASRSPPRCPRDSRRHCTQRASPQHSQVLELRLSSARMR
jgi:hypothetical protein